MVADWSAVVSHFIPSTLCDSVTVRDGNRTHKFKFGSVTFEVRFGFALCYSSGSVR